MKIVFFGTSHFAAKVFEKLIENREEVVAVVTRPDRTKGRSLQLSPPPVKEAVIRIKPELPIFQPEKASTPEFASTLQSFEADLFVVVAYGEIIKKDLLGIPKLGCINIHASLLPKFRGAAPIQRSLMAGEKETGITIIDMSPQMDAGDILAIQSIPLSDQITFGELEPLLCDLSCQLLFKVIKQFEQGSVARIPQQHSLATFAPKITPNEEEIDWTKSAQEIKDLIRALSPYPGASCKILLGAERKRLKIKRAEVIEQSGQPGTILSFGKEGFCVACGKNALRLVEVQLEGKKSMPVGDFIRGVHEPVTILQ
jgi:methionyl-tRNA formyltransferase